MEDGGTSLPNLRFSISRLHTTLLLLTAIVFCCPDVKTIGCTVQEQKDAPPPMMPKWRPIGAVFIVVYLATKAGFTFLGLALDQLWPSAIPGQWLSQPV